MKKKLYKLIAILPVIALMLPILTFAANLDEKVELHSRDYVSEQMIQLVSSGSSTPTGLAIAGSAHLEVAAGAELNLLSRIILQPSTASLPAGWIIFWHNACPYVALNSATGVVTGIAEGTAIVLAQIHDTSHSPWRPVGDVVMFFVTVTSSTNTPTGLAITGNAAPQIRIGEQFNLQNQLTIQRPGVAMPADWIIFWHNACPYVTLSPGIVTGVAEGIAIVLAQIHDTSHSPWRPVGDVVTFFVTVVAAQHSGPGIVFDTSSLATAGTMQTMNINITEAHRLPSPIGSYTILTVSTAQNGVETFTQQAATSTTVEIIFDITTARLDVLLIDCIPAFLEGSGEVFARGQWVRP